MSGDPWRLMALAAISEGFCPDDGTPLDPQPQGGWCAECRTPWGVRGKWYSIRNGDTVVTRYPSPPWVPADAPL